MTLSDNERHSVLWKRIKEALEVELQSLRERNDSMKLDDRETARVRGRIAQVKDILAWDMPPRDVDPA